VTAGGRVLAVSALAPTLAAARGSAYEAAGRISWPGVQFRRDIGAEAAVVSGGEGAP
jgi:phosphoribosylamine--glycine ligase